MNKNELKEKILNQFIWEDEDGVFNIDYCNSCEMFIKQKMLDGIGVCEHCESEDISIFEVEE